MCIGTPPPLYARKDVTRLRVIAQYRNYEGVTAQPEVTEPTWNGQNKILQKGLRAVPFRWMDVTEWERREAFNAWPNMRGLTEGENIVERLSCFDSRFAQELHGWTDEEREIVEEALRNGPGHGSDYIIVEQPKAPAPYRLYDQHRKIAGRRTLEHVLSDIKGAFDTAGFDVGTALMYERENLNDPKVIEFLNGLTVQEPDEELVEA